MNSRLGGTEALSYIIDRKVYVLKLRVAREVLSIFGLHFLEHSNSNNKIDNDVAISYF